MALTEAINRTINAKKKRLEILDVSVDADIEEDANFEALHSALLLSPEDINLLLEQTNSDLDELLTYLGNEKNTGIKKSLRKAIASFYGTIHRISNAFLYKISVDNYTQACIDPLKRACDHIEIIAAQCAKPSTLADAKLSYASVLRSDRRNGSVDLGNNISLARRKPFAIASTNRVVIGPAKDAAERLTSSAATKVAMQKSVNPTRLKLEVQRVNLGPNCSVILEGRSLNAAALSACSSQKSNSIRD